MFNYNALNDYEFEELCKDVMGRMLNTPLRSFGKGRDGGIDLKDNNPTYNIVVQVKHYINSDYSNLISTLKKEVNKVNKLNPKQYYVCCAKILSPPNVKEIYGLFEDYMKSEENIITLKEIDDFLKKPDNNDIARKHFKLWLSASNILSEMFNQSVFIDSQVLIDDIKEEYKYYVETSEYRECTKYLDENRILLLTGSPGVGKTTISKMLILNYLDKGYRLRYSTNGEISEIKNSLVANAETPEIILLDDCLGQYYFNLIGNNHSIELVSLIKFVTRMNNKILILNCRVTLLNEAKRVVGEFEKIIENKSVRIKIIDMDKMKNSDKSKIFYNHIYFNEVPKEYYNSIMENKNFSKIINHRNYNPRIIEHITQYRNYKDISPENYYSFILKYLNNPDQIWKDEFEIKLREIDRILMIILFSLTDTTVNEAALKECFNKRVQSSNKIDTTLNNFEDVVTRLNKSMIKIIDNNGKREISVINPSVNDYLNKIFFQNELELENIRNAIVFYEQIERCYRNDGMDKVIEKRILDNTFLNLKLYKLKEYKNIEVLLVYNISKLKILSPQYKNCIIQYIKKLESVSVEDINYVNKVNVVEEFLREPLATYYDINKLLLESSVIESLYKNLDLENLIYMINTIYINVISKNDKLFFQKFEELSISYLEQEIEKYLKNFNVYDFTYNIDINQYFNESSYEVKTLGLTDRDEAYSNMIEYTIDKLCCKFIEDINYEINEVLYELQVDSLVDELNIYIEKLDLSIYISQEEVRRYVQSYGKTDYEEFDDAFYDEFY